MAVTHIDAARKRQGNRIVEASHDLRNSDCKRVGTFLSLIGDKWSIPIIVILADGPARFNELRRLIDGISQRMLTHTLRGLEREGLVLRTDHETSPARVDYRLTPLGWSICEPVLNLCVWGRQHIDTIEDARQEYDARMGDN